MARAKAVLCIWCVTAGIKMKRHQRKGVGQNQKVRARGRRLGRKGKLKNMFCLKKAALVISVMT